MTHNPKTVQPNFDALANGSKKFELRRNDREFQVGDTLVMREYDPDAGYYSGRQVLARVDYVLQVPGSGLEDGHCVMSLAAFSAHTEKASYERARA